MVNILVCLLAIVIFGTFMVPPAVSVNITTYENVAFCDPYCDVYGYYKQGKWCYTDANIDVYCCGSQHDRYCCTDVRKDVGDMYPAVSTCPNSSWWYYQWRVIVGLLSTLVVMLMLAACCYYCCAGNSRSRVTALRRTMRQGGEESARQSNQLHFDPSSPYAFTPPEYNTLPKDPPKYGDIFDGIGIANPVYEPNQEGSNIQANDNNVSNECNTGNNFNANTEGVHNVNEEQHSISQCPPPEYSSTINIEDTTGYSDIIEDHITMDVYVTDTQQDHNGIPLNTLNTETTGASNTSVVSEPLSQNNAESTTIITTENNSKSECTCDEQDNTVVQIIEDGQLVTSENENKLSNSKYTGLSVTQDQ